MAFAISQRYIASEDAIATASEDEIERKVSSTPFSSQNDASTPSEGRDFSACGPNAKTTLRTPAFSAFSQAWLTSISL